MKIYAISGLGADHRVFNKLQLDYQLTHISWIKPEKNESIEAYATRLSKVINQQEDFGIIGLSFGGMIATEISKKMNPSFTILISSVETRSELPLIFRLFSKTNLINFFPEQFFKIPHPLAYCFFGSEEKALLRSILDDTDLTFAKWAVSVLLTWSNNVQLKNCLKICGTKDKVLPPTNCKNTVLVGDGTHFMIYDRAEEVSEVINSWISDIKS
ncbi:alpha/beta hydrolase [Limibacter armeniacum]|uniref:alpha/beta fold hydrolase n=1 Tax=Limibacter armeniacum TaxID=466084 RepID=UPI002FE66A92